MSKKQDTMILIISSEDDYSTSKVMQWLVQMNKKIIRISTKNNIKALKLNINNKNTSIAIQANGQQIDLDKINTYWYRRSKLNYSHFIPEQEIISKEINQQLKTAMLKELKIFDQFIHNHLRKKKHIGSYLKNEVNKIEILQTALINNLDIPDTLITSNKKELLKFHKKHPGVIFKPIYEAPFFFNKNLGTLYAYTKRLKTKYLEKLPDTFFPILLQEEIQKKYEVRTFYLNKEMYSIAIFPGINKETSVDSRTINKDYKPRRAPYRLPVSYRKKVTKLMESINLNCGSIDTIVTPDNRFIFLEINPIGQFGKLSHIGNYFLEKRIAEYLSN